MSLPDQVSSPAVYLMIGVIPAAAQRDIEIMGLLGQLAMCPDKLQDVTHIVREHLVDYPFSFPGWSGLARRTTQKYGLPDPLSYMQHPWRPDR